MQIDQILTAALDQNASDVHLTVGRPPVFRILGNLVTQEDFPSLLPDDTQALAQQMMAERQQAEFTSTGEADFAYSIKGKGRFRVNVFRQRGSVALALRLINYQILSLEELGLPPVVGEFTQKHKGLVLVTGPTGSGKTTTLAAMVDKINSSRQGHIITLEDPIEYLHRHNQCIVNQREIGADSRSFAAALRAALREDPDVILVGEMRDLETISTAVTAAETGHLVLATLHTSSAAQTIERITDVFPPHQQNQIRLQLAETIQGIVSQQLLPRAGAPGRVAAVEVLVATPAIRNLIREGKTHQIPAAIQTGAKFGMQLMDTALRELYRRGQISRETLTSRVTDLSSLMGL